SCTTVPQQHSASSRPTRRSSDLFTVGTTIAAATPPAPRATRVQTHHLLYQRPERSGPLFLPFSGYSSVSCTSLSMLSPTTETTRSEEHTSELQSRENLVCRLLP